MATAAKLAAGRGQHVVEWDTYEALRAWRESRQGRVVLADDRGKLTICPPAVRSPRAFRANVTAIEALAGDVSWSKLPTW
ncbi:MAG: hypothetical protein P4L84_02740 [Isosphaeraceae bacterium]|nr:hypothetical protein [Isosphaeraceae bacterium]